MTKPLRIYTDNEGWIKEVLAELTDKESWKDKDSGKTIVKCVGLRRICGKLFGTIVECNTNSVLVDLEKGYWLATCYLVVNLFTDNEDDLPIQISQTGTAESFLEDLGDFAAYPGASTDTKAEARAFKKIMALDSLLAAEEMISKSAQIIRKKKGKAIQMQPNVINKMCKEQSIDLDKFLSHNDVEVSLTELTKKQADELLIVLNSYSTKPTNIPKEIKCES